MHRITRNKGKLVQQLQQSQTDQRRALSGRPYEYLKSLPKFGEHIFKLAQIQPFAQCLPHVSDLTLKLLRIRSRGAPSSSDQSGGPSRPQFPIQHVKSIGQGGSLDQAKPHSPLTFVEFPGRSTDQKQDQAKIPQPGLMKSGWNKLEYWTKQIFMPSEHDQKLQLVTNKLRDITVERIRNETKKHGVVMSTFYGISEAYRNLGRGHHVIQATDVINLRINQKTEPCLIMVDYADKRLDRETGELVDTLPPGQNLQELSDEERDKVLQGTIRVCHLPSLLMLNKLAYTARLLNEEVRDGSQPPELWAPKQSHPELLMTDEQRTEFANQMQQKLTDVEFFKKEIVEYRAILKQRAPELMAALFEDYEEPRGT
jgi:hypothetical protein